MSPLATKDRCRACKALISFGITAKGKRMPLDVEPVRFDSVVTERIIDGPGKGEVLRDDLRGLQVFVDRSSIRSATVEDYQAGKPLYRSHFATCPDADRFRR